MCVPVSLFDVATCQDTCTTRIISVLQVVTVSEPHIYIHTYVHNIYTYIYECVYTVHVCVPHCELCTYVCSPPIENTVETR